MENEDTKIQIQRLIDHELGPGIGDHAVAGKIADIGEIVDIHKGLGSLCEFALPITAELHLGDPFIIDAPNLPRGTGTRMAQPSSLPLRFGSTSPSALAAPVEVGIIAIAAARAR